MEKKISFDKGKRNIEIKLFNEDIFEYDILSEIKEFISNKDQQQNYFYHVTSYNDKILIEKQGYNTPTLDQILFDISNLNNEEKEVSIISAYKAIVWRTKFRPTDEHLMYIERREGKDIFDAKRFENEMEEEIFKSKK